MTRVKLLLLEFEDDNTLPLLVGSSSEMSGEEIKRKRLAHDKPFATLRPCTWRSLESALTVPRYISEVVIAAYKLGLSIYRDWVINETGASYLKHEGFHKIVEKDYDISRIIRKWSTKDWDKDIGVRFGHIHRAVESCFADGISIWPPDLEPKDGPKGRRMTFLSALEPLPYFGWVHFNESYRYPWEGKADLPSYTLPAWSDPGPAEKAQGI